MDRILILEIADRFSNRQFISFYAGVWGGVVNNDYTGIVAPEFEAENIGITEDNKVITVTADRQYLKEVFSLEDVIENDTSFYFNASTKLLLVHFGDSRNPSHYKNIELGFVIGFYNTTNEVFNGIFNGFEYESRLQDNFSFVDTKDDLFFGKQKYQTASFSITNNDRKYSQFSVGLGVKNRTGSLVRALLWSGDVSQGVDYNDAKILYQGTILKIKEGLTLTLNVDDIRKSLDRKFPTRYLTTSFYPFIKDDDTKLIPEIWGKTFSVPCLCLNETENDDKTSGFVDYKYMVCDNFRTMASDSIKEVLANNQKIYIGAESKPPLSVDNDNDIYIFTVNHERFQVVDDSGDIKYENQGNVSIDCYGYISDEDQHLIENPLEIIREKIFDVYNYPFNDVYFNLANWTEFETFYADREYEVGYYFEDQLQLIKMIEDIQRDTLGKFIWSSSLQFEWQIDDFDEIKFFVPMAARVSPTYLDIDVNSQEVLASVRVGYKKKWDGRSTTIFTWIQDDSNVDSALEDFNSTKSKDFETRLTNINGLNDLSERISSFTSFSKDTFSVVVPPDKQPGEKNLIDPVDIKSGEFVAVDITDPDGVILGQTVCQILERGKLEGGTYNVPLTVRIFNYGPQFNLVFNDGGTIVNAIANDQGTDVNIIGNDLGDLI